MKLQKEKTKLDQYKYSFNKMFKYRGMYFDIIVMKFPITEEFQFSFSKSSGSGGQNVNKLNTRVTLKWNLQRTKAISEAWKKRFQEKYKNHINSGGVVIITSQRYRTQARNISDCIGKLSSWLEKTRHTPKKRKATKPTKASVEKRLKNKQKKSEIKKMRKKFC